MPTEIQLIDTEELSSIIYLVATVLFIFASEEARRVELDRQRGINDNTNLSSKITEIASIITIIAGVVGAIAADQIVRQAGIQNKQDSSKDSIRSNLKISVGSWISVVGYILVASGAKDQVEEGDEITIV